jgi:prepilin-type N-terminal cleavage/methylation domain-containing protein
MKTTVSDKWQVTSDKMADASRSPHVSRFTFHVSGFTLIELLVVIAIMATLAALLLPVAGAVKKHQYIYNTQAEMAKLETAIDRYKAAYGFYPPSPPIPTLINPSTYVNQLYYELVGTVYNSTNTTYTTLDGSTQISAGNVPTAFGVGGFMNCSKPGGGEESSAAKNFLPDLRPNQIWPGYTNSMVSVYLLRTAVGGPDTTYQPMGQQDLNPWRYVYPGTNNPGSYDLWIQLSISGKTNLICNWSKSVQINSPLP